MVRTSKGADVVESIKCSETWLEGTLGPGKICHICSKAEKVFIGKTLAFIDRRQNIKASFPVFWLLCRQCNDNGWQPPLEASMGHIVYNNTKTGEAIPVIAF